MFEIARQMRGLKRGSESSRHGDERVFLLDSTLCVSAQRSFLTTFVLLWPYHHGLQL